MKGKLSLMRKRDAGGRGSERQRERERVDFHAGSVTDKKEHGSRTMKDSKKTFNSQLNPRFG